MAGIGAERITELRHDFENVLKILEQAPIIDKLLEVPTSEF